MGYLNGSMVTFTLLLHCNGVALHPQSMDLHLWFYLATTIKLEGRSISIYKKCVYWSSSWSLLLASLFRNIHLWQNLPRSPMAKTHPFTSTSMDWRQQTNTATSGDFDPPNGRESNERIRFHLVYLIYSLENDMEPKNFTFVKKRKNLPNLHFRVPW